MKIPAGADRSASAAGFERRAARAEALKIGSRATEPLAFAAGLCRAQARAATLLERAHARSPLRGSLEADARPLSAAVQEVLAFSAEGGPAFLAAEASSRGSEDDETALARLGAYWSGDRRTTEDYLSRAMLRPYAEVLRVHRVAPDRPRGSGGCPFCGGSAWIAARVGGSTLEGARRLLGCALCGGDWPVGRILCPACAEGDPLKLPSYSTAGHPTVRIEACETCRRYVKSIDLSVDARPIPEIDDLLSISMDLWAVEQGFERIEPGMAGL